MKIHKYETLYPRTLWVVNVKNEDPVALTNKFIFYKNVPGWREIDKHIDDELVESVDSVIAGCYVVEEKSTGKYGLLLILFMIEEVNTSTIAHESVHVADYFYEVCGCNSEDYSDGNEAYAYLVGWVAGCIANVLIKEKDGKTE